MTSPDEAAVPAPVLEVRVHQAVWEEREPPWSIPCAFRQTQKKRHRRRDTEEEEAAEEEAAEEAKERCV